MNPWKGVNDFFMKEIWGADTASLTGYKAYLIKTLRLLYVAAREFTEVQLTLRAMSLVYTTLLSLVPLLAVSFSVLKAFGVHNKIEPLLYNFLSPLGPKGVEITDRIIGFVNNMRVGVLGSIGLVLLVYTVISLMNKVEESFNSIWRVKGSRTFMRRFSDYMSVILIGPVLVVSALGLTASIMSTTLMRKLVAIEPFGVIVSFTGKLLPYILVCAAFTFVYAYVPNTRVKLLSAGVGGVFGGVLWQTTGWGFASFIVTSTKYAAVYSGFAILILFMIWLYLSWLILLIGAEISFYHQHPRLFMITKDSHLPNTTLLERTALSIMFLIGYNFYHEKEPWTLDGMLRVLDVHVESVQDVVSILEKKKLIVETGDDPPAYIPARDMETVPLKEIVDAVRISDEISASRGIVPIREIDEIIQTMDAAIGDVLAGKTLKDIVLSHQGEPFPA